MLLSIGLFVVGFLLARYIANTIKNTQVLYEDESRFFEDDAFSKAAPVKKESIAA